MINDFVDTLPRKTAQLRKDEACLVSTRQYRKDSPHCAPRGVTEAGASLYKFE